MTHQEAMALITPTGLIAASRADLQAVQPIVEAHPELIEAMNALAPKPGEEVPQRVAARFGRLDILRYFVEKGVEPDLFVATALSMTERVDAYLAAHPKEVNAKGVHGIALMVHANTPEMVEALLKHGADPTQSLAQLCWTGRVELLEVTLAHGANVNPPDMGRRPLHIAAAQGHLPAVEFLVKHGADTTVRAKGADWEFKTALALALMKDHPEVAAFLRKHTPLPMPAPPRQYRRGRRPRFRRRFVR